MDKLTVNSYAKVNLFLSVLKKRRDNYHSLQTIFERISLCDKLIMRDRADGRIVFTCSDNRLPSDERNLAVKAALAIQRLAGKGRGATIRLIKKVPLGSGMGGGSSNAAHVLTGLNKLWGLRLPLAKIVSIASQIGSDVPFFVYNRSFAWASGRGERVKPLSALKNKVLWHVIAAPDINVSTPLIYSHWDKLSSGKNSRLSGLTRPASNAKLISLAFKEKDAFSLSQIVFNSLELVTEDLYPQVGRLKRSFASLGVKTILMSGSGPAVFGIVSTRKEAAAVAKQLKDRYRVKFAVVARTV